MLIYTIVLFYLPFALAYWRVKSIETWATKIGLGIFIASLVMLAFIFWAVRGPGSAFAAVGLIFVFVYPVFFIGSGIGLGAKAKVYALRGFKRRSRLMMWLPLAGYAALLMWFAHSSFQKQRSAIAKQSAYQSLTVEETLESHNLSIAISAQIELSYRCHFDASAGAFHAGCEAKDYDLDYRLKHARERSEKAPHLWGITVFPNAQNCKEYTLNKRDCIAPEKLRQWCARRPELSASVWCKNELLYKLDYDGYRAPSEAALALDRQSWAAADIQSIGTDINGAPVHVQCSKIRDQLNADRLAAKSKNKPLGRLCRVSFLVAENIMVEGRFNSHNPETTKDSASHIYAQAHAYWNEMSGEAIGE